MKLIFLVILLLCTLTAGAIDYTIDSVHISSDILHEQRIIVIYKPSGLQKSDTVTVVYLLDGEFSEYRYKEIVNEHFERPVIGVGIVNTDRRRDMLPVNEPGKFLEFIASGLMPEIEAEFIIDRRILFGHSFAGGFTLYAMLQRPGLFDKYIASSPLPITNMIDTPLYKKLDDSLKKPVVLYFSYGSNDLKQVRKWGGRLVGNLEELKLAKINWKNEVFEGENHNTSDIISLINGLKYR